MARIPCCHISPNGFEYDRVVFEFSSGWFVVELVSDMFGFKVSDKEVEEFVACVVEAHVLSKVSNV